jgi:hypothetical protein
VTLMRCPVQLCNGRRPRHHLVCKICWQQSPGWIRSAILAERDECRAAMTSHTQKLLELRDKLIAILSQRNRSRFAKPQGTQLPLLTT